VLTPGRYVGAADTEEDDVPFLERFASVQSALTEHFAEAEKLKKVIQAKLEKVVVNG